jgi:hypothetical protein
MICLVQFKWVLGRSGVLARDNWIIAGRIGAKFTKEEGSYVIQHYLSIFMRNILIFH